VKSAKPMTVRYERLTDMPKPQRLAGKTRRLSDAQIARAVADDPDAAPLANAAWFEKARLVMPDGKQPITIRLDRMVLHWFRAHGRGYQSRINAVLKAYVEAHDHKK
jgi:uncharacterized protein (DUF4415 family)